MHAAASKKIFFLQLCLWPLLDPLLDLGSGVDLLSQCHEGGGVGLPENGKIVKENISIAHFFWKSLVPKYYQASLSANMFPKVSPTPMSA